MNTDIFITGGATESSMPAEVMSLANELAQIHGPVRIADESSGYHIYIADPELLLQRGERELDVAHGLHLAVNAEKYIACFPLTKYPNYHGRYDVRTNPCPQTQYLWDHFGSKGRSYSCASSMKTKKKYNVDALLRMLPLVRRRKDFASVKPHVTSGPSRKLMEVDEHGVLVPEFVENAIPLYMLDDDHPARVYLEKRGFDPDRLSREFGVTYCNKAKPEDRSVGRMYGRLPGGVRQCPQGRIILPIMMNGSRMGYQSRLIDKFEDGKYQVWTDKEEWLVVREMLPDGSVKEHFPPTEWYKDGFSPHKYLNAKGSSRNKLLFGLDQAIEFNKDRPRHEKFCVLCEGPLDAAKLGAPAIALLGKNLSAFQAEEIIKNFSVVCTCMDQDAAGGECFESIASHLPGRNGVDVTVPDGHKDAGELSYEEAALLMKQCDPVERNKNNAH